MIYLLKAAAAALALVCAMCVSREYKRFTDKKFAFYDGFLSLLSYIKNELSCRGRSLAEWASEFENDALYETGFISKLRESGSLHTAFVSVKDKLLGVCDDGIKLLDGYFSSFGKSYKREEEGEACQVFSELSRISETERAAGQKNIKAVRTLSFAVALGLIILLL